MFRVLWMKIPLDSQSPCPLDFNHNAMTTLAQIRDAQRQLRQQRILWLDDQPKGILTRIAEEFGVSQPFVSDVLHNRRTSAEGRIEKRLAELGAPGFTPTKAA
jgi:predicted XRE-type DNA-binding protein